MKRAGGTEKAEAKYVFLDIVGYTRPDRSVEAQSFIIGELNAAVNVSVATSSEALGCNDVIFLPTGDGMAIVFLNSASYDIHLRTALQIIETITKLNERATDPTKKFEVRIGISENVDNVIQDINKNRNVAGSGITMARRIMDNADGMQVLVSDIVHNKLSPRRRYMKSFKRFDATGKHDITFPAFQYIGSANGVSRATPLAFEPKPL